MFSKAKSKGSDTKQSLSSDTDMGSAPIKRSAASKAGTRSQSRISGVPSIISADMVIRGAIEAAGEIQFDGEINGDISAKGVVIGEGAKVNGEIIAEKVRVCGTVEGAIKGNKVELSTTALVKGDIVHASLSIENGARFEGNCRHSDNPMGESSSKPRSRPVPRPASAKESPSLTVDPANVSIPSESIDCDAAIMNDAGTELMPTRTDPVADRAFIGRKPIPDLR